MMTAAIVGVASLSLPPSSKARPWNIPLLALVFLAASLLNVRTVLLLPFFLVVVPLVASPLNSIRWRTGQSWVPLVMACSWIVALGIRHLNGDLAAQTHTGSLLQPLLGYRWFGNALWLLIILGGLPFFIPENGARKLVLFRETTPRHLILGLAVWLMLIACVFRWILPGQSVFGLFLVWEALLFLILVVILFAFHSSRRRAFGLSLAALLLALTAWNIAQPEPHALSNPQKSWLQSGIDQMGPDDLLFIDEDPFHFWPFWVPVDVASQGQVQLFADPEHLLQTLQSVSKGWGRSHSRIWVFLDEPSPEAWFVLYLDPTGQPVEVGKSGSRLSLHTFEPGLIPRPIAVWETSGPLDLVREIQGIHEDQIWTEEKFQMTIGPVSQAITQVELYLRGWRPTGAAKLEDDISLEINGQTLPLSRSQSTWFSWDLPHDLDLSRGATLVLNAPTFVPQDLDPETSDSRHLALDLDRIILQSP